MQQSFEEASSVGLILSAEAKGKQVPARPASQAELAVMVAGAPRAAETPVPIEDRFTSRTVHTGYDETPGVTDRFVAFDRHPLALEELPPLDELLRFRAEQAFAELDVEDGAVSIAPR